MACCCPRCRCPGPLGSARCLVPRSAVHRDRNLDPGLAWDLPICRSVLVLGRNLDPQSASVPRACPSAGGRDRSLDPWLAWDLQACRSVVAPDRNLDPRLAWGPRACPSAVTLGPFPDPRLAWVPRVCQSPAAPQAYRSPVAPQAYRLPWGPPACRWAVARDQAARSAPVGRARWSVCPGARDSVAPSVHRLRSAVPGAAGPSPARVLAVVLAPVRTGNGLPGPSPAVAPAGWSSVSGLPAGLPAPRPG